MVQGFGVVVRRSRSYLAAASLAAGLAAASVARVHAEELPPLRERAAFGVYAMGLPYYPEALKRMESPAHLGTRVDIVSGFVDWDYVLGERRDLLLSGNGKRKLLYSWEPHCRAPDDCIRFRDILDGKLDPYFERVAESMKRFPHEIYVRPWAEMNASWSPYRPGSQEARAGTVDEFKEAWRYVVRYFRSRGIRHLRFVFNPDVDDYVDLREIWPGQEYVDVLGIDGYNWGNSGKPGGSTWLEFEAVFDAMYQALTALHDTAPVWICEFGSKEPKKSDGSANSPAPVDPEHSKARWIEGFMSSRAFPRLGAVVYYDAYTPNRDNQRDFRFASSPESLAMIRKQLGLRRARAAGKPNQAAAMSAK